MRVLLAGKQPNSIDPFRLSFDGRGIQTNGGFGTEAYGLTHQSGKKT